MPFQKGDSGNPRGRPKLPAELKELCKSLTEEAINAIADRMRDPKESGSTRFAAAAFLIERGYGKAPQEIQVTHNPLADIDANLLMEFKALLMGQAIIDVAAEPSEPREQRREAVSLAAPAPNGTRA